MWREKCFANIIKLLGVLASLNNFNQTWFLQNIDKSINDITTERFLIANYFSFLDVEYIAID